MKIPAGFVVSGKAMTQLEKYLHGQKQAGRVWYLHLNKNLERIGFKASKFDEWKDYLYSLHSQHHLSGTE
jgi:hypothetical protein